MKTSVFILALPKGSERNKKESLNAMEKLKFLSAFRAKFNFYLRKATETPASATSIYNFAAAGSAETDTLVLNNALGVF